ncbi:MAG: NAD(P)H-binding protein [Solirubrobacteraceae bacterium]|nr:NAD(P)H-binding protein [Solirubrobacteraceae bacterium]
MIAITGASGGLGRRVAELVLEQTDPQSVLLLTRTPDRLADLAKRGARVEKASFKDPTGLKRVLQGVERLLLISTDAVGARLEQHRQAIAAAARAGVWHIAYTSIAQPSADNPALIVPDHLATEQAIRESGLEWTLLRNNLYAEGLVPAVQQALESGVWVSNAGEGRTAYVSRDDCARAAAAVLLTDGHERESYDITGPAALTQAELVALANEIHGANIEYVDQDDEDYAVDLAAAGLPAPAVELIVSVGQAVYSEFFQKVTTDVRALTGQEPATVREILERNR